MPRRDIDIDVHIHVDDIDVYVHIHVADIDFQQHAVSRVLPLANAVPTQATGNGVVSKVILLRMARRESLSDFLNWSYDR